MTRLLSLTLSDHSLWRLGSILVAITATIVLGALLARTLSNRDAASRHATYLVVLASVLILPVVITALDHFGLNWSLRVLAGAESNPAVTAPNANSSATALNSDSLIIDLKPGTRSMPEPPATQATNSVTASSPTFAFSWRNVITVTVVTWGVGTLLLFARLFFGLIRLAGFRARCLAMTDQQLIELLSEVTSRLGMATTPRLLSREGIDVPMALGFLRPAIVMPARLEKIDGLREILIHEAAHLVRRDPLVGVLQRLAGALFWPHPLIFYLNRSLSRACEEVCDNYVLQFGDRFRYSRVLLALGGTFEQAPSSLAVVALMSSRWDLIDRITGLLDDRRNVMLRARPLSKFATAMLLPTIGLTLGLLRSTSAAAPADIVVAAGQSVQEAIDKAPEGATIRLTAGAFKESITITKSLTLQGVGYEKTTIGPDSTALLTQQKKDDFFAALEATSEPEERARIAVAFVNRRLPPTLAIKNTKGVLLRGIRFRGPATGDFPGVLSSKSLVSFVNATGSMRECAVVGPFMDGVRILDGSDVQIENSLVAALWGTGVAVGPGTKLRMCDSDVRNCYHRCVTLLTDQATIERCRISGSAWHGIRYDDCSPKILNNHIFGNARSGIYASGQTSATVVGNVFWRNEMDAMSCWFNNADTIEHNTIIGNLREGIAVVGASKPTLSRNIFAQNPVAVICSKVASRGQPLADAPSGAPRLEANFFFENPRQVQDGEVAKPLPPGNQSADPKVAGAGDNFRLAADSSARLANTGAADPIAFGSPFPIQPEETSIIPDLDTRDYSKWKKPAAREEARRKE
ncbi:MAG TPA: M56 family metallopeptidase [Isosphaeraceae bacterium]|nr:M56 family metallopeptidase [Isosphaeraceae bacterium]